MEINLVVINVGNTRLAIGPFIAGELGEVTRVPIDVGPDAWGEAIGEAWLKVQNRENASIVAASVNPEVNEALEKEIDEVAGRRVVWVGKDLELPIPVLTDEPEQTGIDRVLNVAAAYEQIGNACVVVDAGTAVTVDVCNDAGVFIGGALLPYIDREDIHVNRPSQRKTAVMLFTLLLGLGLVLTFVAIFFRGPGYSFVIPYVTTSGVYFAL